MTCALTLLAGFHSQLHSEMSEAIYKKGWSQNHCLFTENALNLLPFQGQLLISSLWGVDGLLLVLPEEQVL